MIAHASLYTVIPSFDSVPNRLAGSDVVLGRHSRYWIPSSGSSASGLNTVSLDIEVARRMLTHTGAMTISTTPFSGKATPSDAPQFEQHQRNLAALRLIEAWMAEESGYDEAVWPQVKADIDANRLSERNRFSE